MPDARLNRQRRQAPACREEQVSEAGLERIDGDVNAALYRDVALPLTAARQRLKQPRGKHRCRDREGREEQEIIQGDSQPAIVADPGRSAEHEVGREAADGRCAGELEGALDLVRRLATMTAATALPVWVAVTGLDLESQPLFIYLAVIAGCIIYWHRSNIQRMLAGNENRNPRVMLFKPKKTRRSNDES